MSDSGTPPGKPSEREALEERKLALEIEEMRRRASWQGQLRDWLQVATIAGVVFSVIFGLLQLSQAEDARTDDRLDKTLARLAAEDPGVRLAGVSGMQLLIANVREARRNDATLFLIDALANEKNPFVQSSILAVIANLQSLRLSPPAINAALQTAIERDRSLTQWLNIQMAPSDSALRQLAGRKPNATHSDPTERISNEAFRTLTISDYRDALITSRSFANRIGNDNLTRLAGLAQAISLLLVEGGRARDFTGIFCEDCDFTRARDLSLAQFDDSYLSRADFSHVRLTGSSFRNADLSNTSFFDANLEHSDLSSDYPLTTARQNQWIEGQSRGLPLLDCANLRWTNLSHLPLVAVSQFVMKGDAEFSIFATVLQSAEIDSTTRMAEMGIILERTASRDVLDADRNAPSVIKIDQRTQDAALGGLAMAYRYSGYRRTVPPRIEDNVIEFEDYSLFHRRYSTKGVNGAFGGLLVVSDAQRADPFWIEDSRRDREVNVYLNGFLPLYTATQHLGSVVGIGAFEIADPGSAIHIVDWKKPGNVCKQPGHPNLKDLVVQLEY